MLYLAEVKKQTKGFIKGFKTEMKLLACQHTDQTWSPVPGDEWVTSDALEQATGEGVLMLLTLNQNRQIQDKPELASPELVRQLQKLSRLSEKLKEQREEVEKWKQSLRIQFKELSRREMEMESRQEQMDSMVGELSEIEQYRQEAASIREQIAKEQQKINEFNSKFGDLVSLSTEQLTRFQQWLSSSSQASSGSEPNALIVAALTAFSQQQNLFNHYWQNLSEQRSLLEQRQQQLAQKEFFLHNHQETMANSQKSLAEANIQIEVQKTILASKQESLSRLTSTRLANEELQATINHLILGTDDGRNVQTQTLTGLEDLPLGELETTMNQLKADLDRLTQFVNDQEEELTLQSQVVQELEAKLAIANECDRPSIESEIAEQQERKGMLDETLVGQRRNLRERQRIVLQYLQVFRRRQGIIEPEEAFAGNWAVILGQIQDVHGNIEEEQHHLESDIEALEHSLSQIHQIIEQSTAENQQKFAEIQQEEEECLSLRSEVQQLHIRLQILEEVLQPLQNEADALLPQLEELQKIFSL